MPQYYLTPEDEADPHRLPTILVQWMESAPTGDPERVASLARASYNGFRLRLAGRIADAQRWEADADRIQRMLERTGDDETASAVVDQAQEIAEDDHADPNPLARAAYASDAKLAAAIDLPGRGYWYAIALPGCMPDSEWSGPFKTEAAAVEAARDTHGEA